MRRDSSGRVTAYRLGADASLTIDTQYAAGSPWWEAAARPTGQRLRVEGTIIPFDWQPGSSMWEPPDSLTAPQQSITDKGERP